MGPRILVPVAALAVFIGALILFKGMQNTGIEFSGETAFRHVEKIVGFGERTPGSEGAEKTRQYLEAELQRLGWTTKRQVINSDTPRGDLEYINLRARFQNDEWSNGGGMVLLCSHYDTKIYDDFEFLGANDGGSSTGALVELARGFAERPEIASKIELVFFDGEEAIKPNITATDGLYGSREYAKLWRGAPPERKPVAGFLLDMIGEKNVKIEVPNDSPRHLLALVYRSAEKLGYRDRFGIRNSLILDDHVPLNNAGIPTIDLIDLDYDVWHTAGDTMDQISAESLEIVGSTVADAIVQFLAARADD